MVEVFKTNIRDKATASIILSDLNSIFPGGRINFDLEDCDNILRVECEKVIPEKVSEILVRRGFLCEVLE
jgi:hypothetical protein